MMNHTCHEDSLVLTPNGIMCRACNTIVRDWPEPDHAIRLGGSGWPKRVNYTDLCFLVREWPEVPLEIRLGGRVQDQDEYEKLLLAAGLHGYGVETMEWEQ